MKIKKDFTTGIIIGCFIGASIFYSITLDRNNKTAEQIRLGLEGFVNPLVACNSNDVTVGKYKKLKNELGSRIEEMTDKGIVNDMSIYFRDLNSTEWIVINENKPYVAASLAKVPVMVAYYKIAEFNPEILKKKLLFNSDIDLNEKEVYRPSTSLEKGKYYSVEELINRMIVNSGNNSFQLLLENLNKDILVKIYLDLDLSIPSNEIKNLISPKSFSTLWRALYNASYLDKEYSNKALGLLIESDFKSGIVSRIPHDISVAHKFGERTEVKPDNSISLRQLHDCGIVYYPNHPYFLCIMTEGSQFSQLEEAIQTASYSIYQYVAKQYTK